MNTEKDYSLLRPFDLEAAKRGDVICDRYGNSFDFLAEAGCDGEHAIRATCGNISLCKQDLLRMKPLCWVEGKPVYKGDVLYGRDGLKRTAKYEPALTDNSYLWVEEVKNYALKADDLTWTPPKVKRDGWVNVYQPPILIGSKRATGGEIYESQADADFGAGRERIACVRIEWEEPAGGEE